MIRKLLCWLDIHKWKHRHEGRKITYACKRCPKIKNTYDQGIHIL